MLLKHFISSLVYHCWLVVDFTINKKVHLTKISPLFAPNRSIFGASSFYGLKKKKDSTTSHPLGWLLSKTENNKYWGGFREIRIFMLCWNESKMVQLLWKTLWWILKKLKIGLPYHLAIPLPDIYLKELRARPSTDICISMFIAALFTTLQRWKQPKCPWIDEWIYKIWYTHIMEYYSTSKRREFCCMLQHGRTLKTLC